MQINPAAAAASMAAAQAVGNAPRPMPAANTGSTVAPAATVSISQSAQHLAQTASQSAPPARHDGDGDGK